MEEKLRKLQSFLNSHYIEENTFLFFKWIIEQERYMIVHRLFRHDNINEIEFRRMYLTLQHKCLLISYDDSQYNS